MDDKLVNLLEACCEIYNEADIEFTDDGTHIKALMTLEQWFHFTEAMRAFGGPNSPLEEG